MANKINNIQVLLLGAFCVVYLLGLVVNAIQAIAGTAQLAVWHYPFLFGTFCLVRDSLSQNQKCAILIVLNHIRNASKQIIRKVAINMLCTLRALRSLPALFLESYRTYIEKEV